MTARGVRAPADLPWLAVAAGSDLERTAIGLRAAHERSDGIWEPLAPPPSAHAPRPPTDSRAGAPLSNCFLSLCNGRARLASAEPRLQRAGMRVRPFAPCHYSPLPPPLLAAGRNGAEWDPAKRRGERGAVQCSG